MYLDCLKYYRRQPSYPSRYILRAHNKNACENSNEYVYYFIRCFSTFYIYESSSESSLRRPSAPSNLPKSFEYRPFPVGCRDGVSGELGTNRIVLRSRTGNGVLPCGTPFKSLSLTYSVRGAMPDFGTKSLKGFERPGFVGLGPKNEEDDDGPSVSFPFALCPTTGGDDGESSATEAGVEGNEEAGEGETSLNASLRVPG